MLARRIQQQEKATTRRIIDALPRPGDVKAYDVDFASDWDGDQAVHVWFLVEDDLRPSDEKVECVGRFTGEVTRAWLDAELSHLPVVQLRAVKPTWA